MLVFREGDELPAVEPVYWSGFLVEEDGIVGDATPDTSAAETPPRREVNPSEIRATRRPRVVMLAAFMTV